MTAREPCPGYEIRPATRDDVAMARAIMLRTFEEDFRTGFDPAIHRDVDDIPGCYLEPPRHTLLVAVADESQDVIGTGGVRGGALRGGPPELVARYDNERTAQLVRIYVAREHRRCGVGRAVVREALRFILADARYDTIALHTFPHSPGALAFWESIGSRRGEYVHAGSLPEVFFEIGLERARQLVGEST